MHAVDADKRRYATQTEAFQHYFDTEMWQKYINGHSAYDRHDLIQNVPSWMLIVNGDTTWMASDSARLNTLIQSIPRYFTGDVWDVGDSTYIDTMAHHGVLPITLVRRYHALKTAFKNKDLEVILKHAADIGHYIGDAHVPLHTTKNYNGQLTDQKGIHAFWETSIPELLAESEFELIVGKAHYIPDIKVYAWNLIRQSHLLVNDVLQKELEVRSQWPDDKELCPSNRNGNTVFQPCPELTKAYNAAMGDMVETQMRKAILSIASVWWTAFVDAGQPNFSKKEMNNREEEKSQVSSAPDCER